EMSKKHLEDALQAGHRISAGQPHHQPRGPVRLRLGRPSPAPQRTKACSPSATSTATVGWCAGTGSEGIRCLAADFAAGGEAAVLAEAVTVKQNQPFGGWRWPACAGRGNHLSAVDTSDEHLATVGSDCSVRVYDLRTTASPSGSTAATGISNRPIVPKSHATRAVRRQVQRRRPSADLWLGRLRQVWDLGLRLASGDHVRRLSGPHICCPDGLDVKGDRVLTPTTSTAPGSPPNPTVASGRRSSAAALTVWPAAVTTSETSPEPLARLELDSAVYSMAAAEDGRLAVGCRQREAAAGETAVMRRDQQMKFVFNRHMLEFN
uniref:WD_REPEATS_REGION domain-containing protein n=1 Tax=Macrostomum lignano TaxID=282301 RepID=A0A1I8FD44_9PLAT